MKTGRGVLAGAVAALFILGVLPLLVMAGRSFFPQGHLEFTYYRELLSSGREWTLLAHSLTLALLTSFFATLLGVPLGLLFSRTDLPLRRTFTVLFTIPLLIPPYISAVSWLHLLGRQGVLSRFLGPEIAAAVSRLLFGLPGCVLVLATSFLPVVMLLTMTSLRTVNPRLEEAGRLAASWKYVLRHLTLPLIRPGILTAALLVFLLTLGEFGVPAFLRYDVFAVESFTQFSAFYNSGAATAAAFPLMLITLLVLAGERLFSLDRLGQSVPVSGKTTVFHLGRSRGMPALLVGFAGLILVITPLMVLVIQSLEAGAYAEALNRAGDSLWRSLFFAAVGATFLTLLGFFLGYLLHNRSLPVWRAVDSLTVFLFALSGTVTGMGLIMLWNHPATNFIYATPVIIILGYLARYSALTSRITAAGLAQIPPSLEEAARMAGARWFRRLALIVAPLSRRSLWGGWLVGFIFCLRDTGITMLVYPPGQDTLPVRIFTLMANGSDRLIAALCVLMILATLLPLGLGGLWWQRQKG